MQKLTGVSKAEYLSVCGEDSRYAYQFQADDEDILNLATFEDNSPTAWNGHTIIKLDHMMKDSDTRSAYNRDSIVSVKYKNTKAHDKTMMTALVLVIPELRLKEEFIGIIRFKIVEYVGYKIATEVVFGSTEVNADRLDTHDQIFRFEKFTKPGHYKKLKKSMGMKTVSKNWYNDSMTRTTLTFRQMFGYSLWECKGWPVWLQADPSNVDYAYKYNLALEKHTRMQRRNPITYDWENIEVDMTVFDNPQLEFDIPKIYNRMADITQEEKDRILESNGGTFYTHNTINCDRTNKVSPGVKILAAIKSCVGVTQAVFWSLENISGEKYNITHNYTSDIEETKESKTAIGDSEIDTSSGKKFTEIPSEILEYETDTDSFRNGGSKAGILVWLYVTVVTRKNNGGSRPDLIDTSVTCTVLKNPKAPKTRYMFRLRVLTNVPYSFSKGKLIVPEVNMK